MVKVRRRTLKGFGIDHKFNAPIRGATGWALIVRNGIIVAMVEREKLNDRHLIAAGEVVQNRIALGGSQLVVGRKGSAIQR